MRLYIITIKQLDGKVYTIEKEGNSAPEVEAEVKKMLKWFEQIVRIRRIP